MSTPDINRLVSGGSDPRGYAGGSESANPDQVRRRVENVENRERVQLNKALHRPPAAPPPPTRISFETPGVGAVKLTWNAVDDPRVYGYRIYGSPVNNPNSCDPPIGFQPQVADPQRDVVVYVDTITAGASNFYWVASVNRAGQESARIPMHVGAPPATEAGGGAGGATYPPLDITTSYEYEDFLTGTLEDGEIGKLGWSFYDGGAGNGSIHFDVGPGSKAPGIVTLKTSLTVGTRCLLYTPGGTNSNFSGFLPPTVDGLGLTFKARFMFEHTATPPTGGVEYRIGFYLAPGTGLPTAGDIGFYVEKLFGENTWFFVCSNGVDARVDTGIIAYADGVKYLLTIEQTAIDELTFRLLAPGLTPDDSGDVVMDFSRPTDDSGLGYGPFFEVTNETDDTNLVRGLAADFFDIHIQGGRLFGVTLP